MNKTLTSILCFLILSASTCKKEGEDCHYTIAIQNKSGNSVINAIPIPSSNGNCKLDGDTLLPNKTDEYRPFNFCIEKSMTSNDAIVIYIVDPTNFNHPNTYYSCDSVEIKNTVLKRYVLTLEDLKKNNFTVTYP